MSYTLVTTFSPSYYEKYGRESIKTMAENWPGPIVAYVEGEVPKDIPARVECRDLHLMLDFANFVTWTSLVPLVNGKRPDGKYDYNYNAAKFGRKVYAITDPALRSGPFFFVGADVHILKPIPEDFLDGVLGAKPGAFLLRDHLGQHVESDFAGYNPLDPRMDQMLNYYRIMFNSGSFLTLRGWHDCWALDELLAQTGLRQHVNNLSAGIKSTSESLYHVWPNTVLAQYMVHLKGQIKKDPEQTAKALRGAA